MSNGHLQVDYVPTTEVVAAARKFSWEEEADVDEQEDTEEHEKEEEEVAKESGTQGLKEHVKHIWLMYQEQEAGKDEKDRALLAALQGPDEEDKELSVQNEMKLLKTGEDAIAFFAKHGDQSDLQVIFCNPAPEEEGKYKPYDLVVVDEQDRGSEYFMISPKGIVHVCPGKQSEHITLTNWMHQVMVFTVLVSMAFFRNYLTGRAFTRWRSRAAKQIFATHRQRLSQRLFLAKPLFVEAQVKVHGILRNMSFVRLLHFDTHHRGGMELRPFLAQQRELCARADLDSKAEAAREVVDATVKKLMMSNMDGTNPQALLLKKRRSGKMSVYLERQEAEREAYLQRLCEFNRSLIGQFIRLVDVMQQSCLVDLAVSKARTLFERLERTPKLFQVSAAFEVISAGARSTGSHKMTAPMNLQPSKQEFIQGLDKVLEHVASAVDQVAPVATYRKYNRYLKADAVATLAGQVVAQDGTWRACQRDLIQQIHMDFDKAQQFCESHFAPLYDIYLHQQKWDPAAFEKSQHTHEQLAEGMTEMQTFDKHLEKMKTNHTSGFLHIEAQSLKASLVPHVESGLQFLKAQLRALASKTCKYAVERFTEVNHKLQERPQVLEQLVEYVQAFKKVEAEVPKLEGLKTSVEEMYGTLFHHGVRTDMAEDLSRDMLLQRAAIFENTVLPGAQFFVNDQGDHVCSEVSNRFTTVEEECEDLEAEITTGMAADPSHLENATRVLEYLDEVHQRLEGISKNFRYLNDCFTLFMQDPQDTDILEEAQQLWSERSQLWEVALQWTDLQATVAGLSILELDVPRLRCQVQGFVEVLGNMSVDMPGDAVIADLGSNIQAWMVQRIPVYTELTNPVFSGKHLLKAFGMAGSDASGVKVGSLDLIFSEGPVGDKARHNVAEHLAIAAAEHCLSTTVTCVVEAWERTEMRLRRPQNSEAPVLLDDQSEILAQIQEDITSLEQVLRSPHLTGEVKETAEDTLQRLSQANDVLEELLALQERYVLVEPLFRMKVLQADEEVVGAQAVEKFAASDETFRLLMHRGATGHRIVLHFAVQASLSKMLDRISDGLSLAEKGMQKILDSQRQLAPRLWWLADPTLARALAAAQDLAAGEPPASKACKEPVRGKPLEEEAAARAFCDFAPWLFPWIAKASASVEQAALDLRPSPSKEVRRQSTAGDIARKELDRVVDARRSSDTGFSPLGAAPLTQRTTPARLQEDWKSALLTLAATGQARDRFGAASGSVGTGLSALLDDVADSFGQAISGGGSEWTRRVAFHSDFGEILALQMRFTHGPRGTLFGDWVMKTEKTMQLSLGHQVREAIREVGAASAAEVVEAYLAHGEGAIPPGQAVLAALGVYFAFSVQAALADESRGAPSLADIGQMQQELRQVLSRHLRRISLVGPRRALGAALLLQAIHWQEVLTSLECTAAYSEGRRLQDSFEWQRQFQHRYDFTTGEVLLCCLDWSMSYGFEYVGCAPRLVRTPQSERCFLTFAAAMRQQSLASFGCTSLPGCGQAAVVRELASMAAVPLLETAPAQMEASAMQHMLAGVAATNAWSFLRWSKELTCCSGEALAKLAVLASSLRDFQSAMRSETKELTLGGFQVRVASQGAALFVAMPRPVCGNLEARGAAGVPAALTSLLRPLALVRAPAQRILSTLLQLEGFELQESSRLAMKLLAMANDVVHVGSAQNQRHDVQDHSLRQLRSAARAAGAACRKGAEAGLVLLAGLGSFAPGEGSLELRLRAGPAANGVLQTQTQLLRSVCDEESGAKLAGGDHPQLLLLKDPAVDYSLGHEVDSYLEQSCLCKGLPAVPGEEGEMEPSRLSLVATEIVQHAHAGSATVLLGPACAGKTTLLKALHAAVNGLPKPFESTDAPEGFEADAVPEAPPARAFYIWQVYPHALEREQLFGAKRTGKKAQGVLPELLSKIAEGSRSADVGGVAGATPARAPLRPRIDLVVFDGEVESSWADDLWPMLGSRRIAVPDRGMQALPPSVELLFETQSLAKATPAFCTHCAICPVEGLLDLEHHLEAFRKRLLSGSVGRCARIHAPVLVAWLSRLASGMRKDLSSNAELMWAGQVVAAEQLLSLLEASLLAALPMMDDEPTPEAGKFEGNPEEDGDHESSQEELSQELATLLEVWAIWSAAWALGGHLPGHERKRLGAWLVAMMSGKDGLPFGLTALGAHAQDPENLWKLRILSNVCGTSGVAEVNCETKLKLVSELMADDEELGLSKSFIFVPTEETEAICNFFRHQIYADVELGVRILGGPQSGKSALADAFSRCSATLKGRQPEFFRCPHGATSAILEGFLAVKMPRLAGGVRIIVDDVHMAAGSLHERLRQVAESGRIMTGPVQRTGAPPSAAVRKPHLWFDLLGHAFDMTQGKRWLRHFLAVQLPTPQEKSIVHICERLVLHWSTTLPSEEARMMLISHSLAEKLGRLIQEAAESFQRTPQRSFPALPLLDVAKWFKRLSQTTDLITSIAMMKQVVWYEGTQQLGTRLESPEDHARLAGIFEDAGLYRPSDETNGSCFVALNNGTAEYWDQAEAKLKLARIAQSGELGMPLALYEEMIGAALATSRALQFASSSQSAGALLLGPPGSGRKTCARLASHLAKTQLHPPAAVTLEGLREELASLQATVRSRRGFHTFGPLTEELLLHGDCEGFLEDIDNILRQASHFQAREKAPAARTLQRRTSRGSLSVGRTTDASGATEGGLGEDFPEGARLAFILILSPTLAPDWFRRQARMYSGIGSVMDVVWLKPWGREAYLEVAAQLLLPEALQGEGAEEIFHTNPEEIEALRSTAEVAARMPGALELPGALQRSHVPGPALFIAAVTKLKHLLQDKEAALQKESVALDLASNTLAHMAQCEQQFRSEFSGELDKAKESEQEASRLTATLEDLHKDVKEVDAEAVQICERIAQTTAEMEKLEQDVSETMADVQQELRMATLDLRAVPQAIIDDFREAGAPSENLQLVFFAFLDALGVEESWEGVVSLFSGDFAQQLQDLEMDDMLPTTAAMRKRLDRLEELGGLSSDDQGFLSKAALSWSAAFIAAVDKYQEVLDEVAQIRALQEQLRRQTQEQEDAQKAAQELQRQIQKTTQKISHRRSSIDKARRAIGRSAEEVQGLQRLDELLCSAQAEMWQHRPGEIAVELAELNGRMLLGCFLAYYDAYLNREGPVLEQWRLLCVEHRLLEDEGDGRHMPETKLLQLAMPQKDVHGLRPLPPSLLAASDGGPPPLLLDPFGIARPWLSRWLQAQADAAPEELEATSVLGGTFADARAEVLAQDGKLPPSLLVVLGEEFCSSTPQMPKTLPPGLQSWLATQKDFAPGKLFVLSRGAAPPVGCEAVSCVLDFGWAAGAALEDCFLEEVVRLAHPKLGDERVKARKLVEFEQSMVTEAHAKLLEKVGQREEAASEDVFALLPFVDQVAKMRENALRLERQLVQAQEQLAEVETRMNAWRQPVRVALALLHLASAAERWHPGYHAEVQRCTKWLWRYFSAGEGQSPETLAADMPAAWLAGSAARFFPRHHPCLAVCAALASCKEVQRDKAVAGALFDSLKFAAAQLAGKSEDRSDEAGSHTEGGGPTPDFVSIQGWRVLQAAKAKVPMMAEVERSLLEETERWEQALTSAQEILPVSPGPVLDIVTLSAVAPHLVPARLEQLAVQELGSRGAELLGGLGCAGDGPAERIRQAVYDSAGSGRGPPPVILFLTEEEFGAEHRPVVQLTLESCAADAGVTLDVGSLLDPAIGSQAARACQRAQEARSGWLLLLDAAEAPLQRLMPKDPQLHRTLHGFLSLVQASIQADGEVLGPSMLLAVQVHHRAGRTMSLPGLRHLLGPDGARICVSAPRGLRANLLATAADLHEPMVAEDPDRNVLMANLVCFHTLMQQRSRLGDAFLPGGRWALADLSFATEALASCLRPGQSWQEPTQALLSGIYSGCNLAGQALIEALAQDLSAFAGPADALATLLPQELWEQLGERISIGELRGFLEIVLESSRPGADQEDGMLQALLKVPESTLVQSVSPDLQFRLRPTSACLLEAVAYGMDGSFPQDQQSDAKVLKRLEEVMAELGHALKDLWPADESHQEDDIGWPTLLRELQRYNVWQRSVRQSLETTDEVLNMARQDDGTTDAVRAALWKEEVPEIWCQAAGGALDCGGLPLASWLREANSRYNYLDGWCTECVPRVSHWLGGLFCPSDLLTALRRHAATQRSTALDALTLVVARYGGPQGTVAPQDPSNLQAILEQANITEDLESIVEGVDVPLPPSACPLLHGLYLTGGHWSQSQGLVADPSPELRGWLPLLRLLPLTAEEFSRHRQLKETAATKGRQKYYSCPVYRHRRRGEGPLLELQLPSSEDAARWAKSGLSLLCELPGGVA